MIYSETTLECFKDPKHVGKFEDADGFGEEGNMKCGDAMVISIKVKDDRIEDIKFQTYGCVAAVASTEMLCRMAKGKTLDEAENITAKDIAKELGDLPPIKFHCSIMGYKALKNAVQDYRKKHQK